MSGPPPPTLNRFTAPYTIRTLTSADISCICSNESNTADTIRCTQCDKHQHKACLPDLDFARSDSAERQNWTLDNYACFLCRPHAHGVLMEQVAEDCQGNKEAIRDLLEPVVWGEYCARVGLEPGTREPKGFGVGWKTGLAVVFGRMTAVEVQVCRNRMEEGAGVELVREFVGRGGWKEGQGGKGDCAGLEVLGEVLGLKRRGSSGVDEGLGRK